jgi:hypothetical protein
VRIVAGDVAKALHLQRNLPNVCQALGGKKFQSENDLTLIERQAPPSGQSNTVTFVYDLGSRKPESSRYAGLLALRGIGRDVFAALGGGEEYLRRERENFYGDGRDE